MKRLLTTACAVVFVCACLLPLRSPVGAASAIGCGKERWAVKTLTDADAASVEFSPRSSSVQSLRALNGGKPAVTSMKVADAYANHRFEDEKHAVTVRAVLVGWKKEVDRDFHIVIAQPGHPDETMIVEPPDPACSSSPKAVDFGKVRATFVQCFGEPGRWKKLPPMLVDLTGVIYFDPIHGQTGVAPNGVELHPLLAVKTLSGVCPAAGAR